MATLGRWAFLICFCCLALASGVAAGFESSSKQREMDAVRVCGNATVGSMSMTPGSNFVAAVDEEGGGRTVFVNSFDEEIEFVCVSEDGTADIKFSSASLQRSNPPGTPLQDGERGVRRTLDPKRVDNLNRMNKKRVTVSCSFDGFPPGCSMTMIFIRKAPATNCSAGRELSCQVEGWVDALSADSSPTLPYQSNSPRSQLRSFSDAVDTFESVISYSVYGENGWVNCLEFDAADELVDPANSLNDHTKTIRCPLTGEQIGQGPVLIRIEEVTRDGITVGAPVLGSAPVLNCTYIALEPDALVIYDSGGAELDGGGSGSNSGSNSLILPVALSVVAFGLFVALGVIVTMVWKRRRHLRASAMATPLKEGAATTTASGDVRKKLSEHDCTACTSLSGTTASNGSTGYCDLHRPPTALSSLTESSVYQDENVQRLLRDEFDCNKREVFYKKLLARQLSGDPSKINPELVLNQQANVLPYNPTFEIDRSNFCCHKILGNGNFGCVYEGEATGLFHPNSKTKVAIKTVLNAMDMGQLDALLCEVKILTTLKLHLNLVNLMGSCTSLLTETGELWVLLEYCQHGNMKNYLFNHRREFLNSINGVCTTELDSRLLVRWAHSIAKGMEYLARKRIMHGDLAARNILIGGDGSRLVAKVSDFGLSKTFYDNIRYKKQKRNYVPWKWMALEYLKDGCFTITSDVWSYAVVIWEIFSLGEEPYPNKTLEDIKTGYRLPCPDTVTGETSWFPEQTYGRITRNCWIEDPIKRADFGEVVRTVEAELYAEELAEYEELAEEYCSMSRLMMDDETRLKRTSTIKETCSPGYAKAAILRGVPPGSEVIEMPPLQAQEAKSSDQAAASKTRQGGCSYISVEDANNISSLVESRQETSDKNDGGGSSGGYITMETANSASASSSLMEAGRESSCHSPSAPAGGYVTVAAVTGLSC